MKRLTPTIITVAAFVLSSCTGSLGVQPGDAVVPPEMGAPTFEVVVIAADDLGVLDAEISVDGTQIGAIAGEHVVVTWEKTPLTVEAAAEGFHAYTSTVSQFPEGGRIEFRLEPVVLQGRVTSMTGRPLPGVRVALGGSFDTTDNEGGYSVERARPGTISLTRPAWESAEYAWDGVNDRYDMSMAPTVVRAIRASAEDLLDADQSRRLLSLADTTGVNGLVVDLKTEDGTVVYPTKVATASTIGAVRSYFSLSEITSAADEHDLYLIGRIGVFQDNFLAAAQPDHAVLNEDGTLWRSNNGFAWLDPSDPASYEYSISLGEEACLAGFDEVQFDYVSYPVGGAVSKAVFDAEYIQEVRVASINAFLTRAYSVLNPMGCTVSSTVLGIVLESKKDEGVGQLPGSMSRIVDVLSPTLYSTNYPPPWMGFDNPNDHAVEVVGSALRGGVGKLEGHGYYRPWLQTWTISKSDQRSVQKVAEEADMGWMLWSNTANYSTEALPPP
ncbi:MAG: putative glycoside hydrolase [Actinomycetota bacterium]